MATFARLRTPARLSPKPACELGDDRQDSSGESVIFGQIEQYVGGSDGPFLPVSGKLRRKNLYDEPPKATATS